MVSKVDIRQEILRNVQAKEVIASVIADEKGIIAGTAAAKEEAERLGLSLVNILNDGTHVGKGDEVIRFCGTPEQTVMAEEVLIGLLAKPSGIATRANKFVQATEGRPRVVCGAWKKMPPSLKGMIREAVTVGGAFYRIENGPFAYLDKNYIALLGGIKNTLAAVAHLDTCARVIQVKGRYGDVASEACEAAEHGADIVFIDSGEPDDVRRVVERLLQHGLRNRVKLAFGGGVNMENIGELKNLDIDILDIGRPIVDAPILDMRLEIVDIKM